MIERRRFIRLAVVLNLLAGWGLAQEQKKESKPADASPPPVNRAALEKEFADKLSAAVFSGHYSVTGKNSDKPPQMEKYTIAKVTKLKDDYWLFTARIQYGKNDVTVPMTLEVKWAGDTPVITLTDLTIPGLGTFTSRVVIHGERYAGTWQHGNSGGHLWGVIEKADAKPEGKDPAKKEMALLQGEWSMISGTADGQVLPEAYLAQSKRVCKDDETTVTIGPQLLMKAKFTIDPSQKPKTIDYDVIDGFTKGKKHLGIYELEGDTVRFCFGGPGAERPADFSSKSGDRRTLSVWKRNKT